MKNDPQVAEFSETQAALAEAWLKLNGFAVEAEQKAETARREAQATRKAADQAYLALHDHVFGTKHGKRD